MAAANAFVRPAEPSGDGAPEARRAGSAIPRRFDNAVGYAKFVGRVGALAIALGVGGAIATTPAVAKADDSDSASANTNQSDRPSTSGTGSSSPRTKGKPASKRLNASSTEESGATVDSSGHANQSARRPREILHNSPRQTARADVGTSKPSSTANRASETAVTSDSETESGTGAAPTTVQTTESAQQISTAPVTTSTANSAVVSHRAAAQPVAVDAFISSAITYMRDAISVLLNSAPTSPTSPAESPLLLGLLGWVRRQADNFLTGAGLPSAAQATTSTAVGSFAPAAAASPAHAEDPVTGLPDDLQRTILTGVLNEPVDFQFLPDGTILIAEKGGAIRAYQNDQLRDTPLITLSTQTANERGIGGLQVDPDFETNHYIYVSYTAADNHDQLARLTVSGYTGDQTAEALTVDPTSHDVLYRMADEAANYHHGGTMQFDPEGNLFWSVGDNFDFVNSQDLSNPHGKILRLNVRTLNPDGTATVPIDNPFVGVAGALPEIYAYGLRNPFRFVLTPTGQLLAGDVGGAAWEELNLITPGGNYGWPVAEGNCTNCSFVNPIYAYPHVAAPGVPGAISSVLVYTGDALGPEYKGKVFIADYALGWMKELTLDSQYSSLIDEHMFDPEAGTTVQLRQGPDGKIYQLTIYPGTLSVIEAAGGNRTPKAVITATRTDGYSPLTIGFSSSGSSDPEGSPLTYSWDFGDSSSSTDVSTDASPSWTYTANGKYTVTLTVSDGEKTSQTTQQIVVGSTAPTVTILTPTTNAPYNAGDTISFTGTATDAEDGTLPDSAYKWTVVFHHADHVHPFADNIIGKSGTITIPTDESNLDTTWYRLTLTVTDSSGLSTSSSVDVKPRLVNLTFTSTDPDAVYTIDGIPHKGTYTETAVVGVRRTVDVSSPQTTVDGPLIFGDWSDGGSQKHTITTPGIDTTYVVSFDDGTPHSVPDAGALLRQLVDNQFASLKHLADATVDAASAISVNLAQLPGALVSAISQVQQSDPSRAPEILVALVNHIVGQTVSAASPLLDAITDVVATTVVRAAGVGAAITANAIPIALSVVNAPVTVALTVSDLAALYVKLLSAWDPIGLDAWARYVPVSIGRQVNTQSEKIEGSINDLRNDVLAALSIGFVDEPATQAADPNDPLSALTLSLARTNAIANQVRMSLTTMGSSTAATLGSSLETIGQGLPVVLEAVVTGQNVRQVGAVKFRSVERKASSGRSAVHDAIVAAGKEFDGSA